MKKRSFETRKRYFHIWQIAGRNPFRKDRICPCCGQPIKQHRGHDFFRGAFDSIPFLNEDAKRTFLHLILRPGYMIMDYIKGKRETYLAPMTALIIFFAFYSFVLSFTDTRGVYNGIDIQEIDDQYKNDELVNTFVHTLQNVFDVFTLYSHPEKVDSPAKASIAAVESFLVSQGVTQFIGQFFFLTLALWCVLHRKYRFGFSSSAATSAYILCQFCFFMIIMTIATMGRERSLGIWLMIIILMYDFVQMFGIDRRKAVWLTFRVGIMYGVMFAAIITIGTLAVLGYAYIKA